MKLMLHISKHFIFNYVYGDVHMYVRAHKGQKHWITPELQVVCEQPDTGVLGTEFESSRRAVSTVD